MHRFFFFPLLFLYGCTLGPKKETPPVSLPSTYTKSCEGEESISLDAWWTQFNDPILEELIKEAITKNFDIRSALEYINQTRANVFVANAELLPKVDVFGAPANIKTSRDLARTLAPPLPEGGTSALLSGAKNFFITGFDASWEIDFFGKNLSAKKQAQYNAQAAEENAKYTKIITIAEVAKLYTELRSNQHRLFIIQEKIKVFEALLSLTQKLKQCGLTSAIDVESITASLEDIRSQKPDLENELEQGVNNLSFLLGGDLAHYQQLLAKKGKIPQAIGKVPLGLPSDLLNRRPDVKEAEYNLYAAGAAIGQVKAGLFPSFSLTGLLGTSSRTFPNLFNSANKYWVAFPAINWSLFQGGKVLSSISAATAAQKMAAIQYEKTVLSALKEVENSLSGYSGQSLRAGDLLSEGKAQKNVVVLSKNLFQAGLINQQQLLEAYENLFVIQEKYVEVKQQAMNYLIALYKSLGGDWDS